MPILSTTPRKGATPTRVNNAKLATGKKVKVGNKPGVAATEVKQPEVGEDVQKKKKVAEEGQASRKAGAVSKSEVRENAVEAGQGGNSDEADSERTGGGAEKSGRDPATHQEPAVR